MNLVTSLDFLNADFDRYFSLSYQLQFDLNTNKPVSAEALLRKLDDGGEERAPTKVLQSAERTGALNLISLWVIEQALKDFRDLNKANGVKRVSVNMSPSELTDCCLPLKIARLLNRHKLPGHCLEIEILEHIPLIATKAIKDNLFALKKMGIKFVLDDFGCGHTTLSSLSELPIDGIKLDKSFCKHAHSPIYRRYAQNLAEYCYERQLSIVIEGIDSAAIKGIFLDLGFITGQGYYFHKPEPISKLITRDYISIPEISEMMMKLTY